MDEGTRSAELTFRMGIALKESMLKMAIAILKAIVRHIEWLKQNNLKPIWKERLDKMQVKAVRQTVTLVQKQRDIVQEKVVNFEKELDKFKLDKQYELEQYYNVEINKAKKELELTKESKCDPKEIEIKQSLIAMKQKTLDEALDNKRKFEYETNKELLNKNHILQEYKMELKNAEYDLKVCNAKLNSLESNKNIETGRLKREYQDLTNKYLENNEAQMDKEEMSIEELKDTYKNDIDNELKGEYQNKENDKNLKEKIVSDIDKFQDVQENLKNTIDKNVEHDYNSQEYYDNLEQSIDKLSEVYQETDKDIDGLNNDNDVDVVKQMLEKDQAALNVYENMKKNGELEINIPKNQELEIGRG